MASVDGQINGVSLYVPAIPQLGAGFSQTPEYVGFIHTTTLK